MEASELVLEFNEELQGRNKQIGVPLEFKMLVRAMGIWSASDGNSSSWSCSGGRGGGKEILGVVGLTLLRALSDSNSAMSSRLLSGGMMSHPSPPPAKLKVKC